MLGKPAFLDMASKYYVFKVYGIKRYIKHQVRGETMPRIITQLSTGLWGHKLVPYCACL